MTLLDLIRTPLRRQRESDPPVGRTPYASVASVRMVDGRMRTVGELRSNWSRGISQDTSSYLYGDYSPEQMAIAYKTGVTTFVGVNVRCGVDAEIPVRVVDERGEVATDSPAQPFVDDAPRLLWRIMAGNLIWGAIYLRKVYNRHGYPTGLEWLSPMDVKPVVDYSTGQVREYQVYRPYGMEYIKPCDLIVDLTFNPFSDVDGTSAVEVAKVRSDVETNIGRYGAMFFANSARPDLIITTEGDLEDEEMDKAKAKWRKEFKGVMNAFRAAFMGGGKWTVTPITPNPADLAMTDLTAQSDMKILAVLRVNPVLAGIGTAADPLSAQGTYEQIRRTHVDFVAIPDVRMICNILNKQWLHADFGSASGRWTLEPDIAGLTADALGTGDRVTTANAAVAGHVWRVNEAREYTGKEPLPFTIDVNPDWAINLYDKGLIKRKQAQLAIGFSKDTLDPRDPDGYIYDLDPRAKPQQQPSPFQMNFPPHLPPQPEPAKPLPPPAPAQLSAPKDEPVTIEPITPARSADLMLHELTLWAKRVKKDGPTARFNAELLSAEVATFVRSSLDSGWIPAAVFDAAKTAVRENGTPQLGATPDEFTAYWQDFDGLQADIREAWLNSYMASAWNTLKPRLSTTLADADILVALGAAHDELVAAWIGTPDKPGALYQLTLAGMVAGDRALTTGNAAKPRAVTVGVNWDLMSREALDFTRQYSFDLIKNIDQTTVNLVREAIARGITEGLSIDEVSGQLESVFHDPERARTIAESESLRAYNNGAFQRWTNAGVTKARWKTVDSHACEICKRLNGQVADISVGWTDPETGKVYRDNAHPKDRCFRQPILEAA